MAGRIMRWGTVAAVAAAALTLGRTAPARTPGVDGPLAARAVTVTYRSHAGHLRHAVVLLPRRLAPGAALALVISPHGRGGTGAENAVLFGDLPDDGGFVVVSPDGDGDRLGRFSWGAPGQIDDLARMPGIVEQALPEVRIDPKRIYAFGGSMGGQETLLLVARHPQLLAGAAAFDPVVDFAAQYRRFPQIACDATCRAGWHGVEGRVLQRLARREVGGDPARVPGAYAARSPLAHAAAIARSGVPLQLWWSPNDAIVRDPRTQAPRLLESLRRLEPSAPVTAIEGDWAHSHEFRATTFLADALARFGLLPSPPRLSMPGLHIVKEVSL